MTTHDQAPDDCCEGVERIHAKTRSGLTVHDLHDHKGLYKGWVHYQGGTPIWFWNSEGWMHNCPAETEWDLVTDDPSDDLS